VNELVELGHDVTLFASGDSLTRAKLVPVLPIDWLHLPVLSRLGVPFLTTLHGRLDLRGVSDVIGRFPAAPFVSISDNQRGWRVTL
jgi:hypothetical protein